MSENEQEETHEQENEHENGAESQINQTDQVEEEKKEGETGVEDTDEEIEAMKRKVAEMQEEQAKLEQIQKQVEEAMGSSLLDAGAKEDADEKSVFVGNVDFGTTPEELQAHFRSCGTIERITILCNKYTGQPKGFAYVEFADQESVANALVLNESLFRGRQLKVTQKRTNKPGLGRGGGRRPFRAPPFRRASFGRRPGRRAYGYHPYY